MSKRDWGKYAKIGLKAVPGLLVLATLAVALLSAALIGRHYSEQYAHSRNEVAAAYDQGGGRNVMVRCAFIPTRISFDCELSQPDTEGDQRATYYDLRAQQDMAIATMLAATFAFFGVVISGVAVWLVYRTLKEAETTARAAQDAVTATREIGEAQIRAYAIPSEAEVTSHPHAQKIITFTIDARGATPPSNIKIFGDIEVIYSGENAPDTPSKIIGSAESADSHFLRSNKAIYVVLPDHIIADFTVRSIPFSRAFFKFEGVMQYNDVFGNRIEVPTRFGGDLGIGFKGRLKPKLETGVAFRIVEPKERD